MFSKEVFRMKPAVPTSIPYKVFSDVNVKGVQLKKGTNFSLSMQPAHFDSK